MSGDTEDILARIDAVLPPGPESDEQREARKKMIERDRRARQIRRQSVIPPAQDDH